MHVNAETVERPTLKAQQSMPKSQSKRLDSQISKSQTVRPPCNRLSTLHETVRSLCFVGEARAERATCISKARATARRANTPRVKKVSADIFCSSCARSPTPD